MGHLLWRDSRKSLAPSSGSGPAALLLEPVQGEGGLRVLEPAYLARARALCDATGTVLIHDEVQCGCGRTGTFLAAQAAGVTPDVATLAKPLGGGLPIGATLVRAELAEVLQPGDHGTTFGGGPTALRGALVFLEELEEGGLQDAVHARAAELTAALDAHVAAGLAADRRGTGRMQGLLLPGRAGTAQAALLERGVVCCTATPDVLRFLPPYVITSDELAAAMATVGATLKEIES